MMKNILNQRNKNILLWVVFFILLVVVSLSLKSANALLMGVGISFINAGIYWAMHFRHIVRVPDYPAQALMVVVSTTVVRFILVGALLIWALTKTTLTPTSVLLGFVLGQIFFLVNQLIVVAKNNGK